MFPTEEEKPIGLWGAAILVVYQGTEVNEQAEELFFRLVTEMAKNRKITEYLKATNQMLWVGKINTIRNVVMEVVNKESICV